MAKFRVVTVHRVTKIIRRSHEIETGGMAGVAEALVDHKSLPYIGERVENEKWELLEATITDGSGRKGEAIHASNEKA